MTSSTPEPTPPPTAAEQGAAEAILRHFGRTGACEDCALLIRDVVAAVRPIIESEKLDETAMLIDADPVLMLQPSRIAQLIRERAANLRAAERQAEGGEMS